MQNIKISEILEDLTRGLARSPKHGGYKPEVGSIQEKYNLTTKELNYLFKHEKLKNTRAGQAVNIVIEDDTEDISNVENLNDAVTVETVVNNSGLEPGHFENPWDEEIRLARQANNEVEVNK